MIDTLEFPNMPEFPLALKKVLELKLTDEQLNDLAMYIVENYEMAHDEGYDHGVNDSESKISDAYREGYDEAYRESEAYHDNAMADAESQAYQAGYIDGRADGYEQGLDEGNLL